jgi:hypothetical protein
MVSSAIFSSGSELMSDQTCQFVGHAKSYERFEAAHPRTWHTGKSNFSPIEKDALFLHACLGWDSHKLITL